MALINKLKIWYTIFLFLLLASLLYSQQTSTTHSRGKLWETLYNYGFIGDPGAWDYLQITGIGFYPGFNGFNYPNDEELANGYITDANFHNFRSGPWIIAKDAFTLIPPAFTPQKKDFLFYHSSLATGDVGALVGNIMPFQRTENFSENPDFNPLLPEEINYVEYATSTGITVKQRSMQWSFPGYDDFIIYDYTFENTGDIAIESVNQIKSYPQTLNEVWFVFHSGIQVSTKGNLNFHYNDDFLSSSAPAGGFGWHPGSGYTDYYNTEDKMVQGDGKGLLYYSRDYNGGREPVPWDQYGIKDNWQDLLRKVPGSPPELQDPSAFGFIYLYRTPPSGAGDPLDADPSFFNIYSDELEKFQNKTVDFEGFGLNSFSASQIYDFARHNHEPTNSGRLYCWYTGSFGPYNLAPGQKVRLIVAEIAGTLDLHEVLRGDPEHHLKSFTEDYQNDSLAVDIRRNAKAVRNAVKWGIGANINGIDLAADVPDSPPPPECSAVNASAGSDTAIIAIRWNNIAEQVQYQDGSGGVFYDGASDLSGYRIFRGSDKRGIWDLVAQIPRSDFSLYWNTEIGKYEYLDKTVQFGFEYSYYVQSYFTPQDQWTSANGTVVPSAELGELASGDINRTPLTNAKPGPVDVTGGLDVFVAPNPHILDDPNRSFGLSSGDTDLAYKIEFRNLPEKATIKIYSISGDLIATLKHGPDEVGNLSGSKEWYQRSDSGLLIAPGLYIYVVQSETDGSMGSQQVGKLMIIR